MKINGNAIRLGTIDITGVVNRVNSVDADEWNKHVDRARMFNVHREAQSLVFMFGSQEPPYTSRTYPLYEAYQDLIEQVEKAVSVFYRSSGVVCRSIITKLPPGKEIAEHIDTAPFFDEHRRVHVPIQTDDDIHFVVGGERVPMSQGEVWEINNKNPHKVINNSEQDRLQLIVDIKPSM